MGMRAGHALVAVAAENCQQVNAALAAASTAPADVGGASPDTFGDRDGLAGQAGAGRRDIHMVIPRADGQRRTPRGGALQ
ncbi:hypothetical protein [Xanthomonas phaseoli]|uniref:Uncharacterized protein n=1 Tax=Xanthomonas manihotis TaxID=43353 RepID=A0A8I1XQE4_XANMN|nr:hypothetical protein [Xanthomonas phaseoli]KUF29073.1 hypothetical protein AO826_06220 [Xanthomonas phaseoli pv. manihotis]MBO9719908.1 hypothetical protein [Xanthomonas phaseoli pv. manihotis]MBO9755786.1 hypothetical protein [Xanthomonas phaseoli pv. manihotis]MBO9760089.1 hypothetical protein [Xanthomonas phaseoli pv. manihotis]MBO9765096.1 hypothetical protein [Xanthomonas phaseoli pv. manihotis]